MHVHFCMFLGHDVRSSFIVNSFTIPMLDPKLLRAEFEDVAKHLSRRGLNLDKKRFSELEEQRKRLQVRTEELQGQRNKNSKLIGQAKSKGEDATELLTAMETINQELKTSENQLEDLQQELRTWMLELPNLPDTSVPDGKTEDDNQEIRKWGEITNFDFEVKDHVDLG